MDVIAEGTGHARGLIRHMQFVPGETIDKNAACNPILYKIVANFANEDPTLNEDFDKGAIRAVSVVSWNAMENQFYITTPQAVIRYLTAENATFSITTPQNVLFVIKRRLYRHAP
jgi:hypothetical protein